MLKTVPSGSHPWTRAEDEKLIQLMKVHGAEKWPFIASYLDGRTAKQCRERWINYLNPALNKSAFTPEEDDFIVRSVEKIGTKWAQIAKSMNGRTDNAIKNRYYSSLMKRPTRKRLHRFTPSEDDFILQCIGKLGKKWVQIAKRMPGRTPKSIKNRFYSSLKKALLDGELSLPGGSKLENSEEDSECGTDEEQATEEQASSLGAAPSETDEFPLIVTAQNDESISPSSEITPHLPEISLTTPPRTLSIDIYDLIDHDSDATVSPPPPKPCAKVLVEPQKPICVPPPQPLPQQQQQQTGIASQNSPQTRETIPPLSSMLFQPPQNLLPFHSQTIQSSPAYTARVASVPGGFSHLWV
eukprot:c17450_g1_i1.p1 GENE.c17450_g1_i1~~c17450_g1_i1.p1  ORF type:complete len:355 (-),score=58.65 c17450_g1_i1:36-1100(-)